MTYDVLPNDAQRHKLRKEVNKRLDSAMSKLARAHEYAVLHDDSELIRRIEEAQAVTEWARYHAIEDYV